MNKDKHIIIGSDHAAFVLKEKIKQFLCKKDFIVEDIGTKSDKSVNYVDYGKKVAKAISKGAFSKGVLICGTGIGMSITANRFKRVRATLCCDSFTAEMSRAHNDSNILVLGSRIVSDDLAFEIIDIWLKKDFEKGRHLERIKSIDAEFK